jgi:hypothetical protein
VGTLRTHPQNSNDCKPFSFYISHDGLVNLGIDEANVRNSGLLREKEMFDRPMSLALPNTTTIATARCLARLRNRSSVQGTNPGSYRFAKHLLFRVLAPTSSNMCHEEPHGGAAGCLLDLYFYLVLPCQHPSSTLS